MEETMVLSEDEHIMGLYDKEKDDKMIALSREAYAKEEGIELGLKQGEAKKSLSIATKMLEKKMSIDVISEVTGLSKSKIKKLV